MNRPSVSGLSAAVEDARDAALEREPGPGEPVNYHTLCARLDAIRERFPPLYQRALLEPYTETLQRLGEVRFARILDQDRARQGSAGLLLDIAQALLQRGEGYADLATAAFQEILSDLYDGFLSAENRRGIKQPDRVVVPPLVKWGNPGVGPYTWTTQAMSAFGASTSVLSLPPAYARSGVAVWSILGHETAGRDILHADEGLQPELAEQLRKRLSPLGFGLAEYWADRVEEASSDVLGVLNMGPAAALGVIVHLRALAAATGGEPVLRSVGPAEDPRPADLLRALLVAEAVDCLQFSGHARWAKLIAEEALRDAGTLAIAGRELPLDCARQSAQLVADTLVRYKAHALCHHGLGDIQNWRNRDELKVRALRAAYRTALTPPPELLAHSYAAHAVAAAVVEAVCEGAALPQLFSRMLAALKALHDQNAAWGPLLVQHPGSMKRTRSYRPQRAHGPVVSYEAAPYDGPLDLAPSDFPVGPERVSGVHETAPSALGNDDPLERASIS